MGLFSQSGETSSFGKTGPESLRLGVSPRDSSQLRDTVRIKQGILAGENLELLIPQEDKVPGSHCQHIFSLRSLYLCWCGGSSSILLLALFSHG